MKKLLAICTLLLVMPILGMTHTLRTQDQFDVSPCVQPDDTKAAPNLASSFAQGFSLTKTLVNLCASGVYSACCNPLKALTFVCALQSVSLSESQTTTQPSTTVTTSVPISTTSQLRRTAEPTLKAPIPVPTPFAPGVTNTRDTTLKAPSPAPSTARTARETTSASSHVTTLLPNALVQNIDQNLTYNLDGSSVRLQPIKITEGTIPVGQRVVGILSVSPSECGVLLAYNHEHGSVTAADRLTSSGFLSDFNNLFSNVFFVPNGRYNGTVSIVASIKDSRSSVLDEKGLITLTYDSDKASSFAEPTKFSASNFNQSLTYGINGASVALRPVRITSSGNDCAIMLKVRPPDSGFLLLPGHPPRDLIIISGKEVCSDQTKDLQDMIFIYLNRHPGAITISTFAWAKGQEGRAEGRIILNYDKDKVTPLLSPVNYTIQNFEQSGTYLGNGPSIQLKPLNVTGITFYNIDLIVRPRGSGTLLSSGFKQGEEVSLSNSRFSPANLDLVFAGFVFLPDMSYTDQITITGLAYNNDGPNAYLDRAEILISLDYDSQKKTTYSAPSRYSVENLNQTLKYISDRSEVLLKPIKITGSSTYRVSLVVRPSQSGRLLTSGIEPTGSLTKNGLVADLNNFLSNLFFQPNSTYNGIRTISTFVWDEKDGTDMAEGIISVSLEGSENLSTSFQTSFISSDSTIVSKTQTVSTSTTDSSRTARMSSFVSDVPSIDDPDSNPVEQYVYIFGAAGAGLLLCSGGSVIAAYLFGKKKASTELHEQGDVRMASMSNRSVSLPEDRAADQHYAQLPAHQRPDQMYSGVFTSFRDDHDDNQHYAQIPSQSHADKVYEGVFISADQLGQQSYYGQSSSNVDFEQSAYAAQ